VRTARRALFFDADVKDRFAGIVAAGGLEMRPGDFRKRLEIFLYSAFRGGKAVALLESEYLTHTGLGDLPKPVKVESSNRWSLCGRERGGRDQNWDSSPQT
jgi:hypothetical protein